MSNSEAAPEARIAFTAFRSADDPMLLAWTRFRDPLANALRPGDLRARPEDGSRGASGGRPRQEPRESYGRHLGCWRLLATNNRELARGYLLYESYESAAQHVRRLQAASAELVVSLVKGSSGISVSWYASHHDVPVMTSARWYPAISTSAEAAARALAALPASRLVAEADRSAPSGRFIRRSGTKDDADAW